MGRAQEAMDDAVRYAISAADLDAVQFTPTANVRRLYEAERRKHPDADARELAAAADRVEARLRDEGAFT